MAVNFIPEIGNFYVKEEQFNSNDHDIEDGCVTPGNHELLRFDMKTMNVGDTDAHIGDPHQNEDIYEHSHSHGHQHLTDFNEYTLYDDQGSKVISGRKQAFCLMDSDKIPWHQAPRPSGQYDCDYQGISRGWYDLYGARLPCQYIVIDNVPPGKYTLEAKTNAQGVIDERCRGDNVTWHGIEISTDAQGEKQAKSMGDELPWAPEDCIQIDPDNVQAKQVVQAGQSRWKVVEGQHHWMLDFNQDRRAAKLAEKVIKNYEFTQECFVGRPDCPGHDPIMYWLTDDGEVPTGSMSHESPVQFNPQNLKVKRFRHLGGEVWLVDGSQKILHFGPSVGNARRALYFLQKYDCTEKCTVGGGSSPGMMYFKSDIDIDDLPIYDDFYRELDVNVGRSPGDLF